MTPVLPPVADLVSRTSVALEPATDPTLEVADELIVSGADALAALDPASVPVGSFNETLLAQLQIPNGKGPAETGQEPAVVGGMELPLDGNELAEAEVVLPAVENLATLGAELEPAGVAIPAGAPMPGIPVLVTGATATGKRADGQAPMQIEPSAWRLLVRLDGPSQTESVRIEARMVAPTERQQAPSAELTGASPQALQDASAGLASISSATGRSSMPGTIPVPVIDQPLGSPNWSASLGDRVAWLVGKGIQQAEVRLTPPQLGPIEIKIAVDKNGDASVQFGAVHGQVREAIEAAIPRLRDMLAESGVKLADVSVNSQTGRQADDDATGLADGQRAETDDSGQPVVDESAAPEQVVSNSLFDAYA